MARLARHYSREALETRVDYVEGKLDAAIIDLKEAINESRKEFKEAINESKKEFKESHKELKESLEKIVAKAESSRRWSIGIVITIAITVIGFMASVIGFLITNGFQIQF